MLRLQLNTLSHFLAQALVAYPGLKSSKYYELAKEQMPNGCGGVFSFGLKADHDNQ